MCNKEFMLSLINREDKWLPEIWEKYYTPDFWFHKFLETERDYMYYNFWFIFRSKEDSDKYDFDNFFWSNIEPDIYNGNPYQPLKHPTLRW